MANSYLEMVSSIIFGYLMACFEVFGFRAFGGPWTPYFMWKHLRHTKRLNLFTNSIFANLKFWKCWQIRVSRFGKLRFEDFWEFQDVVFGNVKLRTFDNSRISKIRNPTWQILRFVQKFKENLEYGINIFLKTRFFELFNAYNI